MFYYSNRFEEAPFLANTQPISSGRLVATEVAIRSRNSGGKVAVFVNTFFALLFGGGGTAVLLLCGGPAAYYCGVGLCTFASVLLVLMVREVAKTVWHNMRDRDALKAPL